MNINMNLITVWFHVTCVLIFINTSLCDEITSIEKVNNTDVANVEEVKQRENTTRVVTTATTTSTTTETPFKADKVVEVEAPGGALNETINNPASLPDSPLDTMPSKYKRPFKATKPPRSRPTFREAVPPSPTNETVAIQDEGVKAASDNKLPNETIHENPVAAPANDSKVSDEQDKPEPSAAKNDPPKYSLVIPPEKEIVREYPRHSELFRRSTKRLKAKLICYTCDSDSEDGCFNEGLNPTTCKDNHQHCYTRMEVFDHMIDHVTRGCAKLCVEQVEGQLCCKESYCNNQKMKMTLLKDMRSHANVLQREVFWCGVVLSGFWTLVSRLL